MYCIAMNKIIYTVFKSLFRRSIATSSAWTGKPVRSYPITCEQRPTPGWSANRWQCSFRDWRPRPTCPSRTCTWSGSAWARTPPVTPALNSRTWAGSRAWTRPDRCSRTRTLRPGWTRRMPSSWTWSIPTARTWSWAAWARGNPWDTLTTTRTAAVCRKDAPTCSSVPSPTSSGVSVYNMKSNPRISYLG